MTLRSSPTFESLLQQRLSRRGALTAGSLAVAACSFASPSLSAASRGAALPQLAPTREDDLVLAAGYRSSVLVGWGDALFRYAAATTAADLRSGAILRPRSELMQARQFGTNCDAIAYFPGPGNSSRRGVLCVNHEYVQAELVFTALAATFAARAAGRRQWILDHPQAVPWMQSAHGVSVLQVERRPRGWSFAVGGPLTRRVTANTPCEISGPARGAALLRTAADPGGTRVLGTLANCAGGKTPWGTYLAAEENVDDYFGFAHSWGRETEDFATLAAHARFPLPENSLYGWEHVDRRFDVRTEPREALRFGWMVEIDPQNPLAAPKKRTALGRFSHEGANTRLAKDGRVAAYMGDDDMFEYIYKFISRDRVNPLDRVANLDLLDHGTLYVARFDADGSGEWLPLVWDPKGPLNAAAGFANQAEVLIKVRSAADLLGATPMDRPEDIEPSPLTGRVYVACTKNPERLGEQRRDFYANREIEFGVNSANPRARNDYGHIIEMIENDDDAAATRFRWQVFLLAGDPRSADVRFLSRYEDVLRLPLQRSDTYYAGWTDRSTVSPLACPDNLGFDPSGRLWIVSDADVDSIGNNGCYVVPTNGADRGQLRQIASAPVGAEFCGCEFTPDGRTLFLSVQHPGEGGTVEAPVSHWPDGGGLPPRSAVVAIEREDGEPL